MLPDPTFKFTIPSVHDNISLDCRVYNPSHAIINSLEAVWHSRGAVIAHPYAPMGGSYDDGVVLSMASELLKTGFVVGTFNFRGAGDSKGKTSWQAKPELEDYISFLGFFVHYVEGLRPTRSYKPSHPSSGTALSPIQSVVDNSPNPSAGVLKEMTLVIGGYSYGSLIVSHLPRTENILQRFETATKGTAEAEIRLRAFSLSEQWNKNARLYIEARETRLSGSSEKPRHSARGLALAMGGDESEPGTRRASHEGRRSMDAVRRSVDRSRTKLGLRQHSHSSEMTSSAILRESLKPTRIPLPQSCYLLISPLLPPVSNLARFFSRRLSIDEDKFTYSPTLAVYGDDDFFTSQRKLRRWVEGLKARRDSRFRFHEVPGAGHFWREEGADSQMRGVIREWLQSFPV